MNQFIGANKQKKEYLFTYLNWNLKAKPPLVFAVGKEVEIKGVFTLLSKYNQALAVLLNYSLPKTGWLLLFVLQ